MMLRVACINDKSLLLLITLQIFNFMGLIACSDGSETIVSASPEVNDDYFLRSLVPETKALPIIPKDNALTASKFLLGRHLFYDKRLSSNGTISCASCHRQELAFSDGRALAIGATGQKHPRNSQALVNVAYNASLTWANPSLRTLESQIVIPLFGESPIEHGINDSNKDQILARISEDPNYINLFSQAYNIDADAVQGINYQRLIQALASFVRGLVSFSSEFDRFEAGDLNALSDSALRGKQLFFSERLECFHCHGGYNFSDSTIDRSMKFFEVPFHNTGLFNINSQGLYPEDNTGIFEITGRSIDMGRFRAPTLRNIEVTAPYMHDGSIKTLEEVIAFYARGGRIITSGNNAGDGRLNPFKDGFISGFEINEEEKVDLVNFLKSLTDREFLVNPQYSDPWIELN